MSESEMSWSEDELVNLAEFIVDDEFNDISRNLKAYEDYRTDAEFVGSLSAVLMLGSAAMTTIDIEGVLKYPYYVGFGSLTALGIASSLAALHSVHLANKARKRLIE